MKQKNYKTRINVRELKGRLVRLEDLVIILTMLTSKDFQEILSEAQTDEQALAFCAYIMILCGVSNRFLLTFMEGQFPTLTVIQYTEAIDTASIVARVNGKKPGCERKEILDTICAMTPTRDYSATLKHDMI